MGAQLSRAEERAALAEEAAQLARAEARAQTERLRRELAASQQQLLSIAGQGQVPRALTPADERPPPPPRQAWVLPEWADDHDRLSAEPFADKYGVDAAALAAMHAQRQHAHEHAESRRRALAAHNFSVELLSFTEKVL